MRTENQLNPCCPRCAKTLMNNGKVKLMKWHKTLYFGKLRFEQITKQRYRCHNCGYSETVNSLSHNRNTRTWFGYSKPLNEEAQYKQQFRSYRAYHNIKAENCQICHSTEDLEGHEFDYVFPIRFYTLCHNCHKLIEQILRKLKRYSCDSELITRLFSHDSNVQSVNQDKRLKPNLCYALAKCEGVSYL